MSHPQQVSAAPPASAPRAPKRPEPWHPPAPPLSLPPEVLEAPVVPVDAGWVFIDRTDEWRRAMGWSHKEFASRLGIAESYWRAMRAHQKELTISVAERVIRERPELEHILGSAVRYFQERRRRRKPRTPRGLAADLAHALLPFLTAAAAALADAV